MQFESIGDLGNECELCESELTLHYFMNTSVMRHSNQANSLHQQFDTHNSFKKQRTQNSFAYKPKVPPIGNYIQNAKCRILKNDFMQLGSRLVDIWVKCRIWLALQIELPSRRLLKFLFNIELLFAYRRTRTNHVQNNRRRRTTS